MDALGVGVGFAEPLRQLPAGLCLDVGGNVIGNRGQSGRHDAQIVRVADKRCQIGDGVEWENEIAERAVYATPGTGGGVGDLRSVKQSTRYFNIVQASCGGRVGEYRLIVGVEGCER